MKTVSSRVKLIMWQSEDDYKVNFETPRPAHCPLVGRSSGEVYSLFDLNSSGTLIENTENAPKFVPSINERRK